MKKFLYGFILSLFLFNQCLAANEWRAGTGANTILGTSNAADIDIASYQNIVAPLDRLNSNYRRGAQITYASASTLTVGIGEVTCSNSDGSVRKFRANTSATTVAWTDANAASEASSTTFYLYAVADADANTFTVEISTSSSAPGTGICYRRLGSFYNDSSSNITNISNDDAPKYQTYDSGWFAVAANTTYAKTHSLGTTKVLTTIYVSSSFDGSSNCYLVGASNDYDTGQHSGTTISALTATTITLTTSSYGLVYISGGASANLTSGYARIIMQAME